MSTTKVSDVIRCLDTFAPYAFQESYDNSGLIVGQPGQNVNGILVSLDCTEEVIEEAIAKNCNVVVSHHPILFSGLKRVTGSTYVEKAVIKAIKNDVALISCHTNLDNVYQGVNKEFANKLGLVNQQILSPKSELLYKLVTFCPSQNADDIKEALFDAGAGHIGHYSECSFNSTGLGTYKGDEHSKPHLGEKGARHYQEETKIEVILFTHQLNSVLDALLSAHPYEEVAYDILTLENKSHYVGSGMIGELEQEMSTLDFLDYVKKQFNLTVIKHTKEIKGSVKTIAVCGGSGVFLLNKAKNKKADVFISSDIKYHEFFDAEDQIVVMDIGHYESEIHTNTLIKDVLSQKFANFAIHITEKNTNPVNYYI